jgi:sulfur-carrier protein
MTRPDPRSSLFIFVNLHRSLRARSMKPFFSLALNPTSILWHHLSMPKIHIPTPLRQYAGKQPAIDVKGSTVAEALSGLVSQHPDLRRHLYTEDGKLRAFVNVYLNDEDVRYLQKEATAVGDGDDISIVPSIAGGTEI